MKTMKRHIQAPILIFIYEDKLTTSTFLFCFSKIRWYLTPTQQVTIDDAQLPGPCVKNCAECPMTAVAIQQLILSYTTVRIN